MNPNPHTYKYYLLDLGFLLKELALEAKADRELFKDHADNLYFIGQLYGYHRVISLMQQQAESFGIPLSDLRLEGIEPERDLL